MAGIRSHHLHLQWKSKLWAGEFTWGSKTKHCWVISTNFLFSKNYRQRLAMFTPQANFPDLNFFTEGEDDGIKSRLPFKIISTFNHNWCRLVCYRLSINCVLWGSISYKNPFSINRTMYHWPTIVLIIFLWKTLAVNRVPCSRQACIC